MEDIYTQLYNALASIGSPANFAGYNINYYKATPINIEAQDPLIDLDDYLSMFSEIEDTNQAEIIVNEDYGLIDKIQQMWHLLSLLPQVVQKGLFDE